MNNINQLKTFQELEKCLFDAEQNFSDESAMAAYVYLITDSWIIQDGGYESLQSARKCRDFILKLCPDKIKKLGVPGNTAFILPPEKFLLTTADTYKKLACLFKAETRDVQKINEGLVCIMRSANAQQSCTSFLYRYERKSLGIPIYQILNRSRRSSWLSGWHL